MWTNPTRSLTMLVSLSVLLPGRAPAQVRPAAAAATGSALGPDLPVGREVTLSLVGAGALLTGFLVPVDVSPVPAFGLDPAGIRWTADRSVIGRLDPNADRASNWTRNFALLYPLAIAAAVTPTDDWWDGMVARGVVYTEAMMVSQGATLLAKVAVERTRPYAYVPSEDRPDAPTYDVTTERTFRSMPSGHASSAWTGVAVGLTELLLSRPDASWEERSALGFVGGGLAAATASLRVEAGQHFPSDVLVGSGIGLLTGVAVPLLHRDGRSMPTKGAWLEVLGGVATGAVAGVVLTR